MMAFRYGVSLSGMIGSDSEDEALNDSAMLTPDPENARTTTQKGRGRPQASKPRAPARKAVGASARNTKQSTVAKPVAGHKRKALKEQTNGQYGSETEEVEGFDDQDYNTTLPTVSNDELDVSMIAPKPKGRPAKPKSNDVKPTKRQAAPASPKRSRKIQIPEDKVAPRKTVSKKAPSREEKPAEISFDEEPSFHDSDEPEDIEEPEEPEEQPVRRKAVKQTTRAIRQSPPAVKPVVSSRRRAASASDNERMGGDPALRRKLGEMTKKFEIIDLKYRTLREVGVKEAEGNFEKLKKQTDQKAKVANELVASLRADLANQTALMQQTKALQKDLAARDAEISRMKSRSADLSSSLQEVEAENRTLNTKLNNLRNSHSSDPRAPGSVVRGNSASRSVMAGSVEAAQLASLKEDLYGDLTGLMLRSVKREEDADVYDCLQTGRNGTLHFKLAIESDNSTRHEYGECHYTPLIDANQDSALLEILPDYLTEEITFPRERAGMFYARVVQALSKQVMGD